MCVSNYTSLFARSFRRTTTQLATVEESRTVAVVGYLFLAFVFTIVLSVMMWHCVKNRSGYWRQIRRNLDIERKDHERRVYCSAMERSTTDTSDTTDTDGEIYYYQIPNTLNGIRSD